MNSKNIKTLIIILFIFIFCPNINALCYDEELNEWATNIEVLFQKDERSVAATQEITSENEYFAYFLSITPIRNDIKIIVTDGSGNKAEGKEYSDVDLYGVGCFANPEEETYLIEVYGAEDSACPNDLLKTLKYTVPRFNRYIKSEYCEKYPEHELCETYTNKTKNLEEKDFNDVLGEYDRIIKEKELTTSKIFKLIIEYGMYVLIPFIIISVFYITKIIKYKKQEREK